MFAKQTLPKDSEPVREISPKELDQISGGEADKETTERHSLVSSWAVRKSR